MKKKILYNLGLKNKEKNRMQKRLLKLLIIFPLLILIVGCNNKEIPVDDSVYVEPPSAPDNSFQVTKYAPLSYYLPNGFELDDHSINATSNSGQQITYVWSRYVYGTDKVQGSNIEVWTSTNEAKEYNYSPEQYLIEKEEISESLIRNERINGVTWYIGRKSNSSTRAKDTYYVCRKGELIYIVHYRYFTYEKMVDMGRDYILNTLYFEEEKYEQEN